MSAPDTNLKKQKRRHRGPLIGMIVAVLVAGGLLLWMLTSTLVVEPDPAAEEGPSAQTEGTTGLPAEGTVTDPAGADESPQVIEIEPEPNPGAAPAPGD